MRAILVAMRMRGLLVVAALAVVPACSSDDRVTHDFVVESRFEPSGSSHVYLEGVNVEMQLVTSGGRRIPLAPDEPGRQVFTKVPPGAYTLEAWLRPCSGTCSTRLDGPEGTCKSGAFTVPTAAGATLTWPQGSLPCSISLQGRDPQ